MATRDYWANFAGSTTPPSGLAPTFITFINGFGSGIAAPAVTEPGSRGLYKWAYDATQTIAFTLDGATSALGSQRYVYGVLDPQDLFGVTLNAISATQAAQSTLIANFGSTMVGIGNTQFAFGASIYAQGQSLYAIGLSLSIMPALIGTTASSFGSTSVDPSDLFGFLKRAQEFWEGNQTYIKATGIMDFYSRGSSTLLREKTIADNTTQTTKT